MPVSDQVFVDLEAGESVLENDVINLFKKCQTQMLPLMFQMGIVSGFNTHSTICKAIMAIPSRVDGMHTIVNVQLRPVVCPGLAMID